MTIKKKTIMESPEKIYEDDDFYAVEKKRIAEETQKAHRIHEEDIRIHLTAMIPYYDDAEVDDRRLLLLINSLLIHRFSEVWMMYWGIFRQNPNEIREYSDLFGDDLTLSDMNRVITFLDMKKDESKNMVEIGFDEDWEEDEVRIEKEQDEDIEEDLSDEEE